MDVYQPWNRVVEETAEVVGQGDYEVILDPVSF